MADPEHVALVKQGAEAIRQWREENPGVRLDLAGADLDEAYLGGAILREVRGAEQVYRLETVRFISPEAPQRLDFGNDAYAFSPRHNYRYSSGEFSRPYRLSVNPRI
jgi:hypothetical protein